MNDKKKLRYDFNRSLECILPRLVRHLISLQTHKCSLLKICKCVKCKQTSRFLDKIGPEDNFFDAFCVYFEQEYMNIAIKSIIQTELLLGKLWKPMNVRLRTLKSRSRDTIFLNSEFQSLY